MNYQLPKGVSPKKDRHGKVRWRYRRAGHKDVYLQNILGEYGSDQFARCIEDAIVAVTAGTQLPAARPSKRGNVLLRNPGTFGLAWRLLQQEPEYTALDLKTKRNRRDIVEEFLEQRVGAESNMVWAEVPMAMAQRRHVKALLDATHKTHPEKARKLLRGIRMLIRVGLNQEPAWLQPNQDPTYMLKYVNTKAGNRPAWPLAQLAAYELRHPVGTAARTYYVLARWMGNRMGDCCNVRWSDEAEVYDPETGAMVLGFWITQEKNAGRRADGGKRVFVPYTSELRTALAPLDRTTETVLVNKYRQPYAKSGMGKALQEWRWQAGLSKTGFSVHGLRANYITTGSEAGGTTREGMAAAGHDNVKDHETYTKSIESAQLSIRLGRKIDTMLAARGNRGQLLN